MLCDIVDARIVDGYRVQLAFDDRTSGIVDLEPLLSFRGVFAPLRDLEYFKTMTVNADLGTITWPNGADLDPYVLYSHVAGKPMPIA